MNAPAPSGTALAVAQPTRADVFVGQVLPPDRMELVLSTLPAHVKPERFQRNLVVAITQHPKLLNCDPVAVFNEVSKAAALGLYLDPQLGEAYLITGWDSRNNRDAPQLRLGYRGLIKLARQSGHITRAYAHEVCENDPCEIRLGTDKALVHTPDFTKPRGKVLFYYAVAAFADGEVDFEPMALEAIHRIRDRSDGWRAFKAGKIKSTPWATDEEEMAKKTVLRRLLKRLPQSPELADALRVDDADYTDTAPAPRLSVVQRLKANAPATGEGFSEAHVERELGAHDPDTGEIIEAELEAIDDAADEDDFPSDRPSSPPAFDPGQWAADAHRKALTFNHEPALKKWWNSDETKRDRAKLEAANPGLLDTLIGQVRAHGQSLAEGI